MLYTDEMASQDLNTEEFIREIESLPSIWNMESSEYSDRNLRKLAWETLVNKFGGNVVETAAEKNAIVVFLQQICSLSFEL